jgi:hypothetical protein
MKLKLRVALAIIAIFLIWYLVATARSNRLVSLAKEQANAIKLENTSTNPVAPSVKIEGNGDFQLQVTKALLLIKLCDFEMFARVTNAVGIVREDSETSAAATNRPPMVRMTSNTAFHSLTWCAGGLVHEAHHISLAKRRGDTNQINPVFGNVRGYKDYQREELECFALELEILKKMNAPRDEIDFVRSQDGTHFDPNRDGKLDWRDSRPLSPPAQQGR